MSKNDHLHRGRLGTNKKVSPSWSAMHAKNDRDHSGGFKTKKKVSSALHRFYGKNEHFHRGGSKKLQKLITTPPKKSIIMTEQISCHCMSKMIIIFERAQKTLQNTSTKMSSSLDIIAPPIPSCRQIKFGT